MKRFVALLLLCGILSGCSAFPAETVPPSDAETRIPETEASSLQVTGEVVQIDLRDQEITVSGDDGGCLSRDGIVLLSAADVDDLICERQCVQEIA